MGIFYGQDQREPRLFHFRGTSKSSISTCRGKWKNVELNNLCIAEDDPGCLKLLKSYLTSTVLYDSMYKKAYNSGKIYTLAEDLLDFEVLGFSLIGL